jgi:hypothetical protein
VIVAVDVAVSSPGASSQWREKYGGAVRPLVTFAVRRRESPRDMDPVVDALHASVGARRVTQLRELEGKSGVAGVEAKCSAFRRPEAKGTELFMVPCGYV